MALEQQTASQKNAAALKAGMKKKSKKRGFSFGKSIENIKAIRFGGLQTPHHAARKGDILHLMRSNQNKHVLGVAEQELAPVASIKSDSKSWQSSEAAQAKRRRSKPISHNGSSSSSAITSRSIEDKNDQGEHNSEAERHSKKTKQ